ncbi:MAG: hypothetical protein ACREDJ_05700 [Methylocella sp.]
MKTLFAALLLGAATVLPAAPAALAACPKPAAGIPVDPALYIKQVDARTACLERQMAAADATLAATTAACSRQIKQELAAEEAHSMAEARLADAVDAPWVAR